MKANPSALTALAFGSFATFALSASTRADVVVVDAGGAGQYTQIQAAVTAAQDGDTILVKPGSYSAFTIDDKSLSIVGDSATPINVSGTIVVKNLAATRSAVLAGLKSTGLSPATSAPSDGAGLLLRSNQGSVRVQGCTFNGSTTSYFTGKPGVVLETNSAGTAFVACTMKGGRGVGYPAIGYTDNGSPGGEGILAQGSIVALYDCTVDGGRGGDTGYAHAARGGEGAHVSLVNSTGALFASGTHVQGGRGGDSWEDTFNDNTYPGDGGDGLHLDSGTVAQILQCDVQGGPPGVGLICSPAQPPVSGTPYVGSGQPYFFNVSKLGFHAPTPLRENASFQAQVTGEPGARVFLMFSPDTTFLPIPSLRGVVLVSNRHVHPELIAGTIPASGVLSLDLAAPVLGAGVQSTTFYIQASCIDSQGRYVLGSFAPIVVLDSNY